MSNPLRKPGWIVAALIVAGGVALALYAHPRAYRVFVPDPPATVPPMTIADHPWSGRIVGRVAWHGELPKSPPLQGMIAVAGEMPRWTSAANPALPRIDSKGGIADVVVRLELPKDTLVKPWPHPHVRIVMQPGRIDIMQGDVAARVGLIPVGAEVAMQSETRQYAMLRARGAAFFTLPFPTSSPKATRRFDQTGAVELTNAAGYPLERAELFVCEHPYHAITDANGRFEISGVPPGRFDIAARLPNCKIESIDRDPEMGKIVRLNFAEPLTTKATVTVDAGEAQVELVVP